MIPRFRSIVRTRIPGQMNKLESRYADRLELLKRAGQIATYWYEGITLRLARRTGLTPDFVVQLTDGTLELHECKGFMQDDAAVKLKVAATMFPFTFRLARWIKGEWKIEVIEP